MVTEGVGVAASPEVAALTLKTARLLEELGHHVERRPRRCRSSFADDFLLYWSMLALAHRPHRSPRTAARGTPPASTT